MKAPVLAAALLLGLGVARPALGASTRALAVDGFGDAEVVIPDGPGAHPVVVALHGHRGRPDWQCRLGAAIVPDAFVVCPRGIRAPAAAGDAQERYTLADAKTTAREVDAAVAALERAFPGRLEIKGRVLYGHSLGAVHAALMAGAAPERWSVLVLSEGGADTVGALARKLGAAHTRLVLACGTAACDARARTAQRTLSRAGARVETAYVEGAGHHSFGPIVNAMAEAFARLASEG